MEWESLRRSLAGCVEPPVIEPTARTLTRLLTSDPLAVASGRDAKGSWCLGSSHCAMPIFSSALELSPGTAAAAREIRLRLALPTRKCHGGLHSGQVRLFRRFATACHAADVEGAAVATSHCCEDQSRCECLWKPEVRRRLRVHPSYFSPVVPIGTIHGGARHTRGTRLVAHWWHAGMA